MKNLTKIAAVALAASTLTACVEEGSTRSEPTGMRQASSAAESGASQPSTRTAWYAC